MARSRGIGGIYAELTLRDIKFRNGLNNARKQLATFNQSAGKQIEAMSVMTGNLLADLVKKGASFGFDMVKSTVEAASGMEMMETQFGVMLGSEERAKNMIAELRKESVASPLGLTSFADAAKTIMQFGGNAEKAVGQAKMLSEVSMGDAGRFSSLALAFGQIQATGRLMGQDLLQLVNAGFNPLKIIAEETGEDIIELKKRMEDGAISFELVEWAFKKATAEGGRFYKMNEKASRTYVGRMAKVKDAIEQLKIEAGTPLLSALGEGLDGASEGMKNLTNNARQMGEEIAKAIRWALGPLTTENPWEIWKLRGEKAAMELMPDITNAWAAGINAFYDRFMVFRGGKAPEKGFWESFDEYAGAGREVQSERSRAIDARIAELMKRNDLRSVVDSASGEGAGEIPGFGSGIEKARKKARRGSLRDIEVNEYQKRGLSLGPGFNIMGKQEQTLTSIEKIVKDGFSTLKKYPLSPTPVW